ncbi:MAG: 4-(cytidine 5'-diphospho)-2-C-methyl-D-erythritol kinase [Candidatus Limnocylindrales bacterium]|jgi:4-diphosphocytidyl-2-C-methyl-D-erythritol kinase
MSTTGAGGARVHFVRLAPAKLNLTLAVVGRRGDGYHALHSVMVPLSLGDVLTVSAGPARATHDSLRITGLTMPAAPDNLVLRAIAATRAQIAATWHDAPDPPPPLVARLAKRVPVAAGLGGGSSDAAVAIDAALAAWATTLDPEETGALAASLGSDVPFFLAGGAALVTGRGEFVEALPDIEGEPPAVVLVSPRLPLATSAVFKAYAGGARWRDPGRAMEISNRLAAQMRAGLTGAALMVLAEELAAANDLRPAAASLAPGLADLATALQKLTGRPVGQSGSGPTLWSFYATVAEARHAVRFLRRAAADGRLPLVGIGEPLVAATIIAGRQQPRTTRPGADHR